MGLQHVLIIASLLTIETGMTAIHIKFPALTLKAGPRAMARIRAQGLHAADVGTLPGAAGGPKALGIQGLDLALFGEWLPGAPRERSLIGASVGSLALRQRLPAGRRRRHSPPR